MKTRINGNTGIIRAVLSVLLGLAILLAGAVLCTQLVSSGKMEAQTIGTVRWLLLFLTGVITALCATAGREGKGIGWICRGLMIVIMMLYAVIGFGGFGMQLLIGAAVLMAGGAVVMIAAQKRRKKSPVGFRAYR